MVGSSVGIRPLAPEDAEAVAALQNRLWRLTYTGLVPDDVLDSRDDAANTRAWQERATAQVATGRSGEGAVTLVAHDEAGTPVGWASTGPPRDVDAPTDTELWSLYVAVEHQGSGVAARLLEAALPSSSAHLWVLAGNDRANAFYRKVGFDLDGVTKHDPRLGAEELRMVRWADPPGAGAYTEGCRRG